MVAGEIVAGPFVRSACARHLRDLVDGPARWLRFDVQRAQHALDFFPEILRLNGGQFEGVPFALIGFQAFIVGSLFGWLWEGGPLAGFRRFRTAYIEIGKGNGKSPLAGGTGLYMLTNDGEPRAEVYAAATKKDQAMILFKDAVAMRDQSPELRARLTKTPDGPACSNLGYPEKGSFFRAIASEDGQSGPRPHGFFIDELHEHTSPVVVNMAAAGQKSRRQPLTFEITNSGFDKTSICYQHHEYSRLVVDAKPGEKGFDDEWFAYVCALDKGEDPFEDEACWVKANPGLGKIIQPTYLRKQVREARGMPAQASKVRRLNFCEWVDAENPWIEGYLWLQCEDDFDGLEELAECDEVCGALDLSGSRDLTALALTGKKGGKVVARVEFWTPGETAVQRSLSDRVPYDEWIRAGYLHTTPGRVVDYAFVAQQLVDLQTRLPNFRRCAFDAYRIKYLETELDALGSELVLVEHPQGFYKPAAPKDPDTGDKLPVLWMPHSIELLAKDVSDRTLRVERNPALTWNNASAVLEADPKNNKIFTKRKSRGRIDGLVALAMSIGLLRQGAPLEQDIDDFINSPVIA